MVQNFTCPNRPVTDATEVAKAWDMLIRSGEDASMYMLMFHNLDKGYAFKHIDTREYRYLKDIQIRECRVDINNPFKIGF